MSVMPNSNEIIKNITSSDNNIRKSAEELLQSTKRMKIDEALNFFLSSIKSQDKTISQLATLMFKKTLLDDKEYFANNIDINTSEKLINDIFFPLVDQNKEWKFLERVAENLAKLYSVDSSLIQKSLSNIVNLFSNENVIIRRFAIFLLESICDLNLIKEEIIQISYNDFKSLFSKGLDDNDSTVRILTLNATTSLLSSIKNKTLVLEFTSLAKQIIDSLIYCLQQETNNTSFDKGSKAKRCLEALNTLVEIHPKLFKNNLEYFIEIICEILKSNNDVISLVLKQSTFQIILSISKGTPAFLRKSENFKNKFVPLLLFLLKDVDNKNELESWTQNNDDNDYQFDDMFYAAREGIELLAIDLGPKFLDMINPYISKMFNSSDWLEVHGAFYCVGYLAETFKKQFKGEVNNLLNYISHGLEYNNPRVIHASLFCLGMLSVTFKPDLQTEYHKNIIPALGKLIQDDNQNIRVRSRAVMCLIDFLKGLISEEDSTGEIDDYSDILKPYSNDLLSILAKIFEKSLKLNNYSLQEASLNCISMIATIMDQEFSPYYSQIMPFLKNLIVELTSKPSNNVDNKKLISQCISTISFIISSVNKEPEPYIEDFKYFCDLFEKILTSCKEEDPEVISIFKAYSHISTSMKEHFYPYLEKIFPILSEYSLGNIDIKYEDIDINKVTETEDSNIPGLIFQENGVNKKFSMNTFKLQNKVMAFDVLKDICLSMGNKFSPYIEKLLNIAKHNANLLYQKQLRVIALKSFEASIYACDNNENHQKAVFDCIFPTFLTKLVNDVQGKFIRDIKSAFKVFIYVFTELKSVNVVNEQYINTLYDCMKNTITFIEKKKQSIRESLIKDDVYDENDEEGFKEDLEVLNEINRRVMELNGIIYKLYKENLTILVDENLTNLFVEILNNAIENTKDESEIVYTLCFFTDVMQYSNTNSFKKLFNFFVEKSQNIILLSNNSKYKDLSSSLILQNIVFGYGIIAERTSSEEYSNISVSISNTISGVIGSKSNSKEKSEDAECFDNAISSLGKILYFKTQNSDEGLKLAERFLLMLPLKSDLEESDSTLKLLCNQFINCHPLINNKKNYETIKLILNKTEKLDKKHKEENNESFLSKETIDLLLKVKNIVG